MIENMRKYTGLMVVVFVLLAAGFLFTMNDIGTGAAGGGGGPTVLEVHGQSLDQQAYNKSGQRTLQLCSEIGMHNYVNFLMAPDAQQLQQALQLGRFGYNYFTMLRNNLSEEELSRFVANRVILQHAIEDMGLYASEEEISEAVKGLPAFSANGKYSEEAYVSFVDKRLGRLGMTEQYLRDIARENICLNKLVNILGGNLSPARSAVQDQIEAQAQTITLAKVTFNRDDFVEKENPTEEEIKVYWEANQDAYKTDEQRRISYYYIKIPEEVEETKSESTTTDVTEEEPKEAAAKAATAKAERRAAEAKNLKRKVVKFEDSLIDSEDKKKPLDFSALVAEQEGEVVKTELFTRDTLPSELKGLTLRGTLNGNRSLSDIIFQTQTYKNDYDRVSDAQPVGEDGWIIFLLEEIVEPVVLEYADARNKARAQLIGQNATEKVKQAAKDTREEVLELMKSGKDFDTAAREKGLSPVQVGPFSNSTAPPKDEPSARSLHSVARGLNKGDVSESIDEQDRSLFIFVEKRELEDTEENKLRVDGALQGAQIDLMLRTFLNWLNHQHQQAEVKIIANEG